MPDDGSRRARTDDTAAVERRARRGSRSLGAGLVIYGLIGVVILAAGAIGVGRPLDEVGTLAVSLERQREALLDSLETTAETISDAATGVQGMHISLDEARAATERAASLANDVSFTMAEVGRAMNVDILGSQPFAGLSVGFDRAATQLTALSTDLTSVGTALGRNADDARTVGDGLQALRESVDALAELVEAGPRVEVSSAAVADIRLLLYALLAWLLMLALGCIALGLGLVRRASRGR